MSAGDPSVRKDSVRKLLRGPRDRAAFFCSHKTDPSFELDKGVQFLKQRETNLKP